MFHSDINALKRADRLIGKIAGELARSVPGSDEGLLPVNCLLRQIGEEAEGLPPEIRAALKVADVGIERVLDTTGLFDKTTLRELTGWADWMTAALRNVLNDLPIEPFPNGDTAKTDEISSADEALALDIENDGALLVEFCNESREHLRNIEQDVLELETNPTNVETLNSIFRAFHTLKGAAGMFNLRPVMDLAHELEMVLDLARTRKLAVGTGLINVILEGGDTLKRFIEAISRRLEGRGERGEIFIPIQSQLSRVRSMIVGVENVVPEVAGTQSELPQSDAGPGDAQTCGGTVTVDTAKLDSLVDLVGEMVVAQSQILQDKNSVSARSGRLTRSLAQLGRVTKELQRTTMSLRMVPIRSTFQKMNRVVRDVSARLGKQVDLKTEGGDTELDRSLVEAIADPLVHMIRNSIDHGIESPDDRSRDGKPVRGSVRLNAFHQAGNVVIQIADDGRGLDRNEILRKGIERGIVSEKEPPADQEILRLIFAPGFSTATNLTEISGHGVGMDVVRQNIEKLRGRIDIESVEGGGTTFTIVLPLTLAIIDGLIVSIGDQRFVIPTSCIRESFRPTPEMITTIHGKGEMADVRGRTIPLLRLHEFFDITPGTTDLTGAVLVVIENDGESRCLMVDRLIGKQDVVIKNLGRTFRNTPAISGGAVLGDGRVALVIDANALADLRNSGKPLAA